MNLSKLEEKLLKKLSTKPKTTVQLAKAIYGLNANDMKRATILMTARRMNAKMRKSGTKVVISHRRGPYPALISLAA